MCPRYEKGCKTGEGYELCKTICKQTGHAEIIAIQDALKKNHTIKNAQLYLFGHWWCCENCCTTILEHNIQTVYLVENAHQLFTRQNREAVKKRIKEKIKRYKRIFLISIHSFTKKEQGFDRGVEIGLLWNKNMSLLLHIQKELIKNSVHIGRNFPYSGFHYNFTLDKHSKNGLIDNIAIEIRNDLICNEKGIKKYVMLFEDIFKVFIND